MIPAALGEDPLSSPKGVKIEHCFPVAKIGGGFCPLADSMNAIPPYIIPSLKFQKAKILQSLGRGY